MADCGRLLGELRSGQLRLRRSLRTLQKSRRAREEEFGEAGSENAAICDSCRSKHRQLPMKRARNLHLTPDNSPTPTPSSPPFPHKHPRRLSSTPKDPKTLRPPNLDVSLEEALLHRQPELGKREREVSRSQVIVQSGKKAVSKGKKRGLSVSFVGTDEHTDQATHCEHSRSTAERSTDFAAERALGRGLVCSLNSSRYGALDRSISEMRKNRKFPRKYAGDDPKLGYDWIAGLLDAGSYIAEHDDEYFEEMREFRRVNHEECIQAHRPLPSGSLLSTHSTSRAASSSSPHCHCPSSPKTCTTSYVLNDRLFPVPVHQSTDSLPPSRCPVCEDKYKEDPAPKRYVRVSVPRLTLQVPYCIRPHRRRSFDTTDSMGLSQHCLAGWESAQPSLMAPQPSLALSSSLGGPSGQDHLRSHDLLNTSHSIEYNLRSKSAKKPRRH